MVDPEIVCPQVFRPGDRIILNLGEHATRDAAQRVQAAFQTKWPDVDVLVVAAVDLVVVPAGVDEVR